MSELPFDSLQARKRDRPGEDARGTALAGETVVFTGKLWSLGRRDARAVVERLGGSTQDDVTLRTTMLVVGADSYPGGVPDIGRLAADESAASQKLRRAAQLNADRPGRIRVLSEEAFCRLAGLPSSDELRRQHYGQRDVLAMYPALREDHVRYLQKWGFLRPAFRNNADTFFAFAELTVLRQVHAALQTGTSFRAVLRDLQASRSGQLTLDFRLDADPARILALKRRDPVGSSWSTASIDRSTGHAVPSRGDEPSSRMLTTAEEHFLRGSLLDDGAPERQEEAAQAYRRALGEDPDLVAAIINLANIRYARDELAEAQALYERAIALDPTYFEASFNLGNIHHDHGRYHDAELCYREAIALNPRYADAHFYLAVTLEKMGRSGDAQPHWRAYQRLAPDGEWVALAREFSD